MMSPVLPSIGTRMGPGWGAYLKSAPFEGSTFGDVLKEQVRFRIVRSGATDIADVRPDSARAEQLWERPQTRQLVQGVLDIANDVSGSPGGTPLRGFTLATSEPGYVANRAVHNFREAVAPSRDAYDAGVTAARNHVEKTAAVRKGSWLHLDPQRSAGLLYMLDHPQAKLADVPAAMQDSLGRGIKTLLHELNHVSSPRPEEAKHLDWLSEGSAETLARWPGRVEAAAAQLGMEAPRGVGKWFDDEGKPYQEEVDSVRSLLRLTGIDTSSPKDFAKAEQLLNGTPESKLPATIADQVASRYARDPARKQELLRRIEHIVERQIAPDGSQADPKHALELEDEFSMPKVR